MDSSPRNTPHIFINSLKNEINDNFIDFFIKNLTMPWWSNLGAPEATSEKNKTNHEVKDMWYG